MAQAKLLKHSYIAKVRYHLPHSTDFDSEVTGTMWCTSFDDVECLVMDDLDGPGGSVLSLEITQAQEDGSWTRYIDFEKPGPRVTRPSPELVNKWRHGKAATPPAIASQSKKENPPASKPEPKPEPIDPGARAHKRPGKPRKKKKAHPSHKDFWFGNCEGVEMLPLREHHAEPTKIAAYKPRIRLKTGEKT
jgi:hypothetical protein